MANPAAEARAKAQEKWAGATVHERGRKFIRHQHPTEPNRFMLDTSIGPIHYGAGEDQEIDTAWQPTTGAWDYEMTTNDWQTYARDTFNAGDIFRFEKDGEWVEFDPQSLDWIDENNSQQQIAITQAVSAVVNDDVIEFPAGFGSGRHFQYQNQTARLQKLITIDADTDLPAVTLQGSTIHLAANFTIAHSTGVEVYVDGVLWEKANGVRVQTSNRIEFRDAATGQSVFWYLDYPRAWDANREKEVVGQMEVRRQGGPANLFITVRIPKTWIDTATFPIYIDPTVVDEQVGASADDGYESVLGAMFLTNPNRFYSHASDTSFQLYVGLRFQTVNVPNAATIDTAYLELYTDWFDDIRHDLYGEDVDNGAVFTTTTNDITNRTTTTATVALEADNVGDNTWWGSSTEIKTIIQEIVNRGGWAANNDLNLISKYRTSGTYYFQAESYDSNSTFAPKLHIEYTAADSGRGDLDRGIGRGILRGVGRGI